MLDYQLLTHSLIAAVVLFAPGLVGFLARRNLVAMMVSSTIMLQAAMLAMVSFSTFHADDGGELFAVFCAVATFVEAAVILSIIVATARSKGTLDVSSWKQLGEACSDGPVSPSNADFESASAGVDSASHLAPLDSVAAGSDSISGADH